MENETQQLTKVEIALFKWMEENKLNIAAHESLSAEDIRVFRKTQSGNSEDLIRVARTYAENVCATCDKAVKPLARTHFVDAITQLTLKMKTMMPTKTDTLLDEPFVRIWAFKQLAEEEKNLISLSGENHDLQMQDDAVRKYAHIYAQKLGELKLIEDTQAVRDSKERELYNKKIKQLEEVQELKHWRSQV
jgi:hypothetical protein